MISGSSDAAGSCGSARRLTSMQRSARSFAILIWPLPRMLAPNGGRMRRARLAAVIVLDQFPRNIYRGTPLAVATDGLALREAKLALASGADRVVETACRTFFYLPFEHAEDLGEQERSVALFTALGDEEYLDYAIRHRDVIAAYGRFPHRNAMLGRESTAGERDYLSKPGAGF
ncbi:uncharacterized protein (DUF924 family) [Rhizobium leguminosarum]